MKIFYNFPAMKQLVLYVLVPVFLSLIIFSIALLFYNFKAKKNKNRNYYMNFYSYLVCIVISAFLFSVTLAFGLSFLGQMEQYSLTKTYNILYYCYVITPIIPLGFMIYFIRKILKTIKVREIQIEKEKEEQHRRIELKTKKRKKKRKNKKGRKDIL